MRLGTKQVRDGLCADTKTILHTRPFIRWKTDFDSFLCRSVVANLPSWKWNTWYQISRSFNTNLIWTCNQTGMRQTSAAFSISVRIIPDSFIFLRKNCTKIGCSVNYRRVASSVATRAHLNSVNACKLLFSFDVVFTRKRTSVRSNLYFLFPDDIPLGYVCQVVDGGCEARLQAADNPRWSLERGHNGTVICN